VENASWKCRYCHMRFVHPFVRLIHEMKVHWSYPPYEGGAA
jgi:hypothetical protein